MGSHQATLLHCFAEAFRCLGSHWQRSSSRCYAANGIITGSLAGGLLLDQLGTTTLFSLAAGVSLVGIAVFVVGSRVFAAGELGDVTLAS